jgi:hypothetical protein
MSTATRKVFVVVRSWWDYNDEFTDGEDDVIKAFTDRDQAEAYLERCRIRAREERYQYSQGGVGYKIVQMDVPV